MLLDLLALGIAKGKLISLSIALITLCFGKRTATVLSLANAKGCIRELFFFLK